MGKRIYCPFHCSVADYPYGHRSYITLTATLQSERLARMAEAEAAISSVTSELRKCVVMKSSKVNPTDCVRLPEEGTKQSSLLVGSLERPLSNIAPEVDH